MIIGIDGSEANESERVGSSEYAYHLLHSLYRISLADKTPNKFIIFIKQKNINDLPDENEFWKYETIPAAGLWIMRKLVPRLIFKRNIDLFFSPTHYLPILTPIPQICTIHDLGYLMFSEQFNRYDFWQLKYWTAISIFISKYIISVSETTKNDIVRHYPFASNKIETVYHGIDHGVFNENISDNLVRHVKNRYKIRKNYILSVGTLKPSKNIEGIIRAFAKFVKNHEDVSRDYQLVITGKRGWLYESIFKAVNDLKLDDRVVFTDYVTLEEKKALYKGARMLASPSYWEGFGMHVLESMACGTPAVVSPNGSLAEIAGSTGVYVDPNNTDDISYGLLKLAGMNKLEYNKLSYECVLNASRFTWDKTVNKTLQVFNKAIK